MILIADSGSTKTAWRLINSSGTIQSIESVGLNPLFTSDDTFNDTISTLLAYNIVPEEVNKVFFYGAGITDHAQKSKLNSWLQSTFLNAHIHTDSDLLGAARAAFKLKPGVVGILGTGSNSAYYDGIKLSKAIAPLGYILGDEGSGNAMGRKLVTLYIRNGLTKELNKGFEKFYPDYSKLLSNIYTSIQPAKLLASFMPFIVNNLDEPIIANLVKAELESFINLLNFYEIGSDIVLVGSIAFVLQSQLQEVADIQEIRIKKIIKSPIDDLVLYHQAEIL